VIPTGVMNFAPLMQGQVDATAATDTGLWLAQQRGLGEVNIIWAREYLNTPTDVFIVSEALYTSRQELLRTFLQVYKRGTQWMLDHPEEAAQLAVKYAINGKDPIIKIRNAASVSEDTQRHGLGWFNLDVLEQVERTYRELGLIQRPLDMRQLFTNELVQAL
jgi:NitT/TauT family transport system substrate-binding protein